jgi:cellulose synthase (UDP-forming)
MRGFNELLVHVRYPEGVTATPEPPRVAVEGSSRFHLSDLSHFATQPDVALFAFDGFPFTRVPDLGETAVVLPERPTADDASAVLSIAGGFAQVTGQVGARVTVVSPGPDAEEALRGKDALVVGPVERQPLVARWRSSLPLALDGREVEIRRPSPLRSLLQLTGGLGHVLDRRWASATLEDVRELGAILGVESPVSPGRTAVFVTSTTSTLPPFRAFLGHAESRSLTGADVLLLSGERRWMFRIGPSFGRGELDPWTRLRWFLANHWVMLLPLLVAGVLVLGLDVRRSLGERMRRRLEIGEGQA